MKKRVFAVVLAALMALTSLTGCERTLKNAIDEENRRTECVELDLDKVKDEVNGFHFKNLTWGLKATEAHTASVQGLGSMSGYTQDGGISYTLNNYTKVLNCRNDNAGISFTPDDECYLVSFVFSSEESYYKPLTLEELFAQYLTVLTEKFGEPDDENVRTQKVSDVNMTYHTYYWTYETPDGKKTQMQWASAIPNATTELSYVTLGFIWVREDLQKELEEVQQ